MKDLDFEELPPINSCSIGIIGLGYVGLPLCLRIRKNKNMSKN